MEQFAEKKTLQNSFYREKSCETFAIEVNFVKRFISNQIWRNISHERKFCETFSVETN